MLADGQISRYGSDMDKKKHSQTLAEWFTEWRAEHDQTRDDVAGETGLSTATIRSLELGIHKPHLRTYSRIAILTDIPLGMLLRMPLHEA